VLDETLTPERRAQILLDIDALNDERDELKQRRDEIEFYIGDIKLQLAELGVLP
jgi:hypothetical protein